MKKKNKLKRVEELYNLETLILNLFNENPDQANEKIKKWLDPHVPANQHAVIRKVLSELYVDEGGRYFLKRKI